MSILIPGAEMPKNYTVLLRIYPPKNGVCFVEQLDIDDDILAEYWARVIPPHGRLIDGDVAEAIGFTEEDAAGKDFYDGILFAADFISQQPTVIEAEEEGE